MIFADNDNQSLKSYKKFMHFSCFNLSLHKQIKARKYKFISVIIKNMMLYCAIVAFTRVINCVHKTHSMKSIFLNKVLKYIPFYVTLKGVMFEKKGLCNKFSLNLIKTLLGWMKIFPIIYIIEAENEKHVSYKGWINKEIVRLITFGAFY